MITNLKGGILGGETGSNNYEVPDARDSRFSQDSTGMRLAEIPNKEGVDPVEIISSG